jgi:hypothetical protein
MPDNEIATLTAPELARRDQLEAEIDGHIASFKAAGDALAEIRESRL